MFATNTLEIMVGKGNPKNIKNVHDLAEKDVKVAACAPDVPCGSYSKEAFDKAGVTVHPVSEETSVSSVVTKVSLGEADAGIVYHTDVQAGGDKISGVAIPPDQNVTPSIRSSSSRKRLTRPGRPPSWTTCSARRARRSWRATARSSNRAHPPRSPPGRDRLTWRTSWE